MVLIGGAVTRQPQQRSGLATPCTTSSAAMHSQCGEPGRRIFLRSHAGGSRTRQAAARVPPPGNGARAPRRGGSKRRLARVSELPTAAPGGAKLLSRQTTRDRGGRRHGIGHRRGRRHGRKRWARISRFERRHELDPGGRRVLGGLGARTEERLGSTLVQAGPGTGPGSRWHDPDPGPGRFIASSRRLPQLCSELLFGPWLYLLLAAPQATSPPRRAQGVDV